jgi:hypothetical protein
MAEDNERAAGDRLLGENDEIVEEAGPEVEAHKASIDRASGERLMRDEDRDADADEGRERRRR